MPNPDRPGADVSTAKNPRAFWLGPASYWQPEYITTSAWITHAPFASWLMEVLRPRGVIELGTHYGFSCFVFAEAARRLGLDTSILALDSWVGDDQAGLYGEEVYESVAAISRSDYPDTVDLLRGWFSQSRPQVADRSADLLHIDGRHGYEDVTEDYEQWRSTVRDGGIILFHDIAERVDGYGVWRLWEELSAKYPSFAFEHGHGLGVLAVGEPPKGPLAELFTADAETSSMIRRDYERLAARIERTVWLETKPAEVESLHEVVDVLQHQIADLRREVEDLERAVKGYRSSASWQVTRPLRAIADSVRRRENR
jgi:hypothetical protein